MLIMLMFTISIIQLCAQKKYGYTMLHLRCGDRDAQKDKVYFSPVIELNIVDFPKYTKGMDYTIHKYSVRYYNYAIARWFEFYIYQHHGIAVNDPEKYERNAVSVVLDEKSEGGCDLQKINADCFFTDKNKLEAQRNAAILESKQPANANLICEVVAL